MYLFYTYSGIYIYISVFIRWKLILNGKLNLPTIELHTVQKNLFYREWNFQMNHLYSTIVC